MKIQDDGAERKLILSLAGGAAVCFGLALVLYLSAPENDRLYGGPVYGFLNFLTIAGAACILAAIVIAILNFLARLASSDAAKTAVGAVKQAATEIGRPKITTSSGMSTADELEKWVRLRDAGVVTQEEFEVARAELLKTVG